MREDVVYSAIYWDAEQEFYYVKRFTLEPSDKLQCFINEHPDSKLISLSEVEYPRFEIMFGGKHKERENEIIEVAEFIGVKSYKAKGKRLTNYSVDNIKEIEPVIKKESEKADQEIDEIEEAGQSEDAKDSSSGDDPAQMSLFTE